MTSIKHLQQQMLAEHGGPPLIRIGHVYIVPLVLFYNKRAWYGLFRVSGYAIFRYPYASDIVACMQASQL